MAGGGRSTSGGIPVPHFPSRTSRRTPRHVATPTFPARHTTTVRTSDGLTVCERLAKLHSSTRPEKLVDHGHGDRVRRGPVRATAGRRRRQARVMGRAAAEQGVPLRRLLRDVPRVPRAQAGQPRPQHLAVSTLVGARRRLERSTAIRTSTGPAFFRAGARLDTSLAPVEPGVRRRPRARIARTSMDRRESTAHAGGGTDLDRGVPLPHRYSPAGVPVAAATVLSAAALTAFLSLHQH